MSRTFHLITRAGSYCLYTAVHKLSSMFCMPRSHMQHQSCEFLFYAWELIQEIHSEKHIKEYFNEKPICSCEKDVVISSLAFFRAETPLARQSAPMHLSCHVLSVTSNTFYTAKFVTVQQYRVDAFFIIDNTAKYHILFKPRII